MPTSVLSKLANSNRKTKLTFLLLSDFLMGLIAWIIFGPPLVNAVATEFEITIFDTF